MLSEFASSGGGMVHAENRRLRLWKPILFTCECSATYKNMEVFGKPILVA